MLLTVPKRRGRTTPCRATWGSTRVLQEAEGARAKHRQNPVLWFLRERRGKAGEAVLRSVSFNNFSRLWGTGAFSSCLVAGLVMIRAKEYSLLKYKSLIEEGVQQWALDWLVCIRKVSSRANHGYLYGLASPGRGTLSSARLPARASRIQGKITKYS